MNILKKLGITPGPWKWNGYDIDTEDNRETVAHIEGFGWEKEEDMRLMASSPELLERDIKFLNSLENMRSSIEEDVEESGDDLSMLTDCIDQIIDMFDIFPDTKATGKTWGEICELLKK